MSDKIIVLKDGLKQQEGSPEEVYNYSINHFVADFLGHPNFMNAVVEAEADGYTRVRLDDGTTLLTNPATSFLRDAQAEVVVRAQKFTLGPLSEYQEDSSKNSLFGKIVDRSYMGGEVSYYVQLENDSVVHVIGFARRTALKREEKVYITVDPEDCRLIPLEN